jgi:hypothetical protein
MTVKTVVLTKGQTISPKARPTISAIARSAGALLDMRDLAQMLAHVHDAEIEISEGPEAYARGAEKHLTSG